MSKHRSKVSVFERSLQTTRALRSRTKRRFLPLFDHCINLALDSHARGYFKRAGRELAYARKVAAYL